MYNIDKKYFIIFYDKSFSRKFKVDIPSGKIRFALRELNNNGSIEILKIYEVMK